MRLGKKKEKDKEAEIRSVDGIIRLICLSKGQAPLKGKFFFYFLSIFFFLLFFKWLMSFYLYSFEISVKVRMQNNVVLGKTRKT